MRNRIRSRLTVVCSLKLKRAWKVREEELSGLSVTLCAGRVNSEVRRRAAPPPPSLPAADTKTYFYHIIINSYIKKKKTKPLARRESSTRDAPPETDMSQISTRRQNTFQIKRWAPVACGSY